VDEAAVGIVVNKKVGKAVIRNKVKRRVKYFLRNYSELIKPDFKYIVKAKPLSGESDWSMIREDLRTIFQDIQLSE
jgi:ribonuclease P protein component